MFVIAHVVELKTMETYLKGREEEVDVELRMMHADV